MAGVVARDQLGVVGVQVAAIAVEALAGQLRREVHRAPVGAEPAGERVEAGEVTPPLSETAPSGPSARETRTLPPPRRSRTKACGCPWVSPGHRFGAAEVNATRWPSGAIAGASELGSALVTDAPPGSPS